VLDAIARLGLNAQGPCAQLLQNAVPSGAPPAGGHGLPWFVTLNVGGLPTATALVAGAATGPFTFLGIAVTEPGGTARVLSAPEMTTALQGREFFVDRQSVQLTEGQFDVIGPFWRPSRESPSPYDPIYEIWVGAGAGHDTRRYYTTLAAAHLYNDMTWFAAAPTC
jgi:hypothetical protein